MFKLGGGGPKCSKCVDLWGFRSICVIFVGITIGWVGLQFVAVPPSVALLAETHMHTEKTDEILQRLTTVEQLVLELKSDVKEIKKEVIKSNRKQ